MLSYLTNKDLIIKKKIYLFLLFSLSKDILTRSISWHLPKEIRSQENVREFRRNLGEEVNQKTKITVSLLVNEVYEYGRRSNLTGLYGDVYNQFPMTSSAYRF